MDLILKYFPWITALQQAQFSRLEALYNHWNAQINVISRNDIDALYEHHVLHSLAIARIITFRPGTRILDVGTGGGFPGIPLAILFPEVSFHLVDSIGKKITVVRAVAEALELANVSADQVRAEHFTEKVDFVVSRAVTQLPQFLKWTVKSIDPKGQNALPNGILYLKGGDLEAEISAAQRKAVVYDLAECFEEPFFETKKLIYIPV